MLAWRWHASKGTERADRRVGRGALAGAALALPLFWMGSLRTSPLRGTKMGSWD